MNRDLLIFKSLKIDVPRRKGLAVAALSLCLAGLLLSANSSRPALAQQSSFNFEDSGQRLGNGPTWVVELADIDRDGDLDALVGEDYPNNLEVWRNNGAGFFSDTGQRLGQIVVRDIAVGDLDGDNDLDLVIVNDFQFADTVYLNNGSGTFSLHQTLDVDSSAAVELGDVNNDGHLDAVILSYNQHKVWLNNGQGTFTATGQSLGGGNAADAGSDVKLGDLNKDGRLDIVIAASSSFATNRIWLNNGGGTFTLSQGSGSAIGSGGVDAGLAVLDFEGDGDLDIFTKQLYLNNGSGQFAISPTGPSLFLTNPTDIDAADFDQDGDPDLLVSTSTSIFALQNDGPTNSGTIYSFPGAASAGTRAAVGDVNGDGKLDVFMPDGPNLPPGNAPNQVWFNRTPRPDRPAVAVDDYLVAETSGGTTVTDSFHVFANDYDPDGDPLVLASFTQPTYGSIQNPSGDLIVYTRTGNGPPDSFTYTVTSSSARPAGVGGLATATGWFFLDCGCAINCLGSARVAATSGQALDLALIYRLRDQVMKSTVSGNRYVNMYYTTTPEIAKILMLDQTALGAEAVTVVELWQSNLASLVDGDGSAVITQPQVDVMKTFLNNLSAAGSADLQQLISAELTSLGPLDDYVGLTMAEAAQMILTDETIYLPLIIK